MSKSMVQLKGPMGQEARPAGDGGSVRGSRSHHNWGSRLGRRKEEALLQSEPARLLELEELAHRTVELMEKHQPKSDRHFIIAMDLLRLQYNLNFMIICEKCYTCHDHDEILAPER